MRKIFIMAALLLLPISANAADYKNVGKAEYYKLLWHVYTIELSTPDGTYKEGLPLRLTLTYHMELSGKDIAARSAEEIRKEGFANEAKLKQWQAEMEKIFPDVKDGTTLTGIYEANGETVFISGGKNIGTIKDKEFGVKFFGIWLSPNSSDPEMTKKLTRDK